MSFISKSKEIFNKLNIVELQKVGIEREDIKTSSHSHHIVTYPPLEALPETIPSKIYPKTNSLSGEIALYLHLPFCTGKCLYCAYVTWPNQQEQFVDRYINAVEREIKLLQNYFHSNLIVNSIYIGGGTPTYLSTIQLNKVLKLLKTKFRVKKGAEITVESSPETLVGKEGRKKLEVLLENGVNRLSIGFQTLSNNVLKLLGRRHNARQSIYSYSLARKVGFKNINIDLIPGLPNQTLKIWKNDLEQTKKLKPDSITCYPLSIKQNAAIWKMFKKHKQMFPKKEDVLLMHIMAQVFFEDKGYTETPAGWFVKDPKKRLPTYKYTKHNNQLALGVSAYSFINNFQYFNYCNLQQYLDSVEKGKLPIWKGTKLSKEELMKRMIIFGLKGGLSKTIFESKFGTGPKNVFKSVWKKLERFKLVEDYKDSIVLTDKGKLFADEISREFF